MSLSRTTRKPVVSDAVTSDIDELQRQYRVMELTRKAHSDEKASSVRMQRAAMEKLRRDNERLKEELSLETRQAKHANHQSASAQIAKLQDAGDLYTRKIELERRRGEELEKQIAKVEKAILDSRREMGGVNASRDASSSIAKQIRILENRLDKALVKFNEALAHNKALRETIDNLRRERVVFDAIYRKLEEELAAKKNTMAAILAESDAAYRARDQAHAEMMALKSAADAQQQNFEQEWSQLGQLIEKDRALKEFIKNQQRERSLRGLGSDPAASEEQALRKKVTKGAWGIAQDKAAIHASMEKVQAYEEAFARIQKATRIADIDQLVHTFVHAEDQNFSLFNYVNDLAHEIERSEETVAELKAEIARFQNANPTSAQEPVDPNARNDPQIGALGPAQLKAAQQVAAVGPDGKPRLDADGKPIIDAGPIGPNDAQRKRMLLELEGKLARTEAQAQAYDSKYGSALQTVGVLKAGISSLFHKLGCHELKAAESLGSAGVTESNMMQYLGLIEQRTNELVGQLQGARDDNAQIRAQEHGQMEDDEEANAAAGDAADAYDAADAADGQDDGDEDGGEEGEEDAVAMEAARRAQQEEDAAGDDDGDIQPLSEDQIRGR